MTRDDVIKLAREAGDDVEHTLPSDLDFLERFAAIVAATERTACARHFDVAMRNAVTAEREACDALRAALQHEADCVEAAKAEIDALRAKIAEMERQEPVRHEFQGRDGDWYPFINQRHYENTVADGTWPIRALYALPGAQGE